MIFKVQESKYIFYKTNGTPPIFYIPFILVSFLSILSFHKKSKLNGTKSLKNI